MLKKLILIVLFIPMGSVISLGQSPVIDISFHNKSLSGILRKFSKTYDIRFAYDNQLLNKTKITVHVKAKDVYTAIDQLLKNTNLHYKIIDKTVLIYPEGEKNHDKYVSIRGVIKDKNTGELLPYANISINGSNSGTSSNLSGFFSLSNVKVNDSSKIIINYLGYQPSTIELSSVNPMEKMLIELNNKASTIDEVAVTGNENEIIEAGNKISHFVVNPAKLSSLPGLGEVDIFHSLKLLPGISTSNEVSKGISIRGSTSDQNLLLFDGFSLYKQDHCFGMVSAINSNVIKNIQVYKGGFESKFGGKVGGVVDITGKSGNQYKPAGHIGINMISANFMIEIPMFKNKVSFILAGRRSYTDVLQTPLYNEVFNSLFSDEGLLLIDIGGTQRIYVNSIDPLFYFYDMNSKITWHPTEKDILSVSLYTSTDKLDIKDPEFDYSNNDSWGNKGISLNWKRQWNKEFSSQLIMNHSYYYNKFKESYLYYDDKNNLQQDDFISENSIKETGLKMNNEWYLNAKGKLEFGLEWNNNSIKYLSSYADTVEVSDLTQKSNLVTSYFQYSYHPVSRLKLMPGIRLSYFGQTNRLYAEPRLSISYYLTDNLYIKAAIGKYYQFVSRLYIPDSYGSYSDFWAIADNQDIPVISANHYIAGFNFKKGNFSLDAEFYKKNIDGLTEFRFNIDTLYPENSVNYFSGKANIRGMDLIVKNSFGPLTGWISYSISKNESQFNELNKGMPFPANNHKKHELKVAALMKVKKWDFSATWIFSSGIPFSKPSDDGRIFVSDMTEGLNNNTLPDYHRLDISASYNYIIKKVRGKAGISVLNIYNRKNIRSRLFFPGETNYELIPVDIKHIGFTPGVFLNVNF